MKRVLLIILFGILVQSLVAQSKFDTIDCSKEFEFLWKEPKAFTDSLPYLEGCFERVGGKELVFEFYDYLLKEDPQNADVLMYKASYLQFNTSRNDTSDFELLRKAISILIEQDIKHSSLNFCYINLGFGLYNFVNTAESNAESSKLNNYEKIKIYKRARKYLKKDVRINDFYNGYAYVAISKINQNLAILYEIEYPKISINYINDTIRFIGEIRHCGEFGGHLEFLKCYSLNDEIVAELYFQNAICQGDTSYIQLLTNYKINEVVKISEADIRDYIDYVYSIDPKEDYLLSNAPTSFGIQSDTLLYHIRTWSGDDAVFSAFRDKYFKIKDDKSK